MDASIFKNDVQFYQFKEESRIGELAVRFWNRNQYCKKQKLSKYYINIILNINCIILITVTKYVYH